MEIRALAWRKFPITVYSEQLDNGHVAQLFLKRSRHVRAKTDTPINIDHRVDNVTTLTQK